MIRKKTDDLDISTSVTVERQEDAQARIQGLQRAINTARGKREMVKGVLRVCKNKKKEDQILCGKELLTIQSYFLV